GESPEVPRSRFPVSSSGRRGSVLRRHTVHASTRSCRRSACPGGPGAYGRRIAGSPVRRRRSPDTSRPSEPPGPPRRPPHATVCGVRGRPGGGGSTAYLRVGRARHRDLTFGDQLVPLLLHFLLRGGREETAGREDLRRFLG